MKCSFCGGNVPDGKGKMFVKKDGKVFYYCNSKCQKNWNMKRLGKKTRWTETFKKLKKEST
jgi:large subunit ribosomal protein L24e